MYTTPMYFVYNTYTTYSIMHTHIRTTLPVPINRYPRYTAAYDSGRTLSLTARAMNPWNTAGAVGVSVVYT